MLNPDISEFTRTNLNRDDIPSQDSEMAMDMSDLGSDGLLFNN